MKKIRNNKQKFTIAGHEIESGINFLSQDFFTVLESVKSDLNKWNKLIENGSIEILSE